MAILLTFVNERGISNQSCILQVKLIVLIGKQVTEGAFFNTAMKSALHTVSCSYPIHDSTVQFKCLLM
jgi:hypothetical protein